MGLPSSSRGLRSSSGAAASLDVGVALTLLDALARFGDGLKAILAALDLCGNVHLGFVGLGCIGALGALQQGLDLRLEFTLGLLHALVAYCLVAAGVGLDLGAVDGHSAQLDQPHLLGQLDHLHEQIGQLLQVQRPEVADRAVLGEVARAQHPKRQVLVQPALNLARAEHARGVTVDQHLDHHGRVERLVACASTFVTRIERLEVQRIDRVANEVGQMPLGQPVLQRRRQQHLLLRFVGAVAHDRSTLTALHGRQGLPFCRPRS